MKKWVKPHIYQLSIPKTTKNQFLGTKISIRRTGENAKLFIFFENLSGKSLSWQGIGYGGMKDYSINEDGEILLVQPVGELYYWGWEQRTTFFAQNAEIIATEHFYVPDWNYYPLFVGKKIKGKFIFSEANAPVNTKPYLFQECFVKNHIKYSNLILPFIPKIFPAEFGMNFCAPTELK